MQYDLTQKKIVAWRQPAGYPMFRFELFFFFHHEHGRGVGTFQVLQEACLASGGGDAPAQLLKTTAARISERAMPFVLSCGDASLVDPSEKRSFRCRRVVRGGHVRVRPARRGFGGISGGGFRWLLLVAWLAACSGQTRQGVYGYAVCCFFLKKNL
jgi:hypothetical protein